MPTVNLSLNVAGLGVSFGQVVARTADGGDVRQPTVPKGFAGTLTTHTSSSQGTATLGDGHGITTGMLVDVYWATGVRYGMTVGTVSGDSVPLTSSGSGDNLPIATTALVVSHAIQVNLDIDTDNLGFIALQASRPSNTDNALCHINFQKSDGTSVWATSLENNGPVTRDLYGSDVTPFSDGPASKAHVSNGSTALDSTLTLVYLQDSTP